MNDDDATTLVDRLTAGLPDTAPPRSLVTEGRSLRGRRRRVRGGAALAAVVLTVGAIAVVPNLLGGDGGASAPDTIAPASTPFPDPPPGTTWVGQEQVVLAVPVDWPVSDAICAEVGYYGVTSGVQSSCRLVLDPPSRFGTVEIGPDVFNQEPGPARCTRSLPEQCRGGLALAGEDIGIAVSLTGTNAAAVIQAMLDTMMVLPDGWTTVPFVTNSTVDERVEALEAAGFDVTVTDRDSIIDNGVASDPALGAPIEVGGAVTLSPATESAGPTEMVARPAVVTPGQTVDLMFPTQELRGWSFTLEISEGEGWRPAFDLVAASGPNSEPSWAPTGEERGMADVGIGGLGPDTVVVPPVAEPGRYRLCTGNAAVEQCTTITVIE